MEFFFAFVVESGFSTTLAQMISSPSLKSSLFPLCLLFPCTWFALLIGSRGLFSVQSFFLCISRDLDNPLYLRNCLGGV